MANSQTKYITIFLVSSHCPLGFPCGSAGKESSCNAEDPGFDPWVGKIPWRRERLSTPVFWPREFHRLYSPRGFKESDTTERFSLHFTVHYTFPQLVLSRNVRSSITLVL